MFRNPSSNRTSGRIARLLVLVCLAAAITPILESMALASARFKVECPFVRHLKHDPIVFPRRPGASHLHAFFGNRTTDAYSTYRSLRRGATTCGLRADKGAYWIPAVYLNGRRYRAVSADFYYRGETDPLTAIRPFPRRLKIIAGNARATGPQDTDMIAWTCKDGGSGALVTRPPDCGTGFVKLLVRFPECWGGQRTDSPNHRSHMHYRVKRPGGRNVCPRSHPVPVPKLNYSFRFPFHDGRGLKLSSGPHFTMHGDFFNAWRQRVLRRLVHRCIHAGIICRSFEA